MQLQTLTLPLRWGVEGWDLGLSDLPGLCACGRVGPARGGRRGDQGRNNFNNVDLTSDFPSLADWETFKNNLDFDPYHQRWRSVEWSDTNL